MTSPKANESGEKEHVHDLATISEFQVGRQFQSYIQFLNRELKKSRKGDPYYQCHFRDRTGRIESMAWNNSDLYRWCQQWQPGDALWISGTLKQENPKYKPSLEIFEFERVSDNPELEKNFDWSLLVESSRWGAEDLKARIYRILQDELNDTRYFQLVRTLFDKYWQILSNLPAASRMHHAMQTGWLEHIWSMTRLAAMIGKHYARYYDDLDPPLHTDILITGAVLHDIGKAVELHYETNSEATYTNPGRLLGHIVMGRDMIREAASQLNPPLDEEQLMRLEHAILSHHGRTEFGSPVVPQTLEAFLLAQIDDMDAKINSISRALRQAQTTDSSTGQAPPLWTDKVTACDPPRSFYRGTNPTLAPESPESPTINDVPMHD